MADARNHGLLAVIAPRFTRELENVATESLAYLLGKSDHVEAAFRGLVSKLTGVCLPDHLTWRAQKGGEDHAIPDLVGLDVHDRHRVVVEGKFWAELTENQPGKYLERLRGQEDECVLLFVGPSMRTDYLWQEIRRACPIEMDLGRDEERSPGSRCAPVLANHKLALTSWRGVSEALLAGAESAGDAESVADLRQLQGLADRMDETAFLPLHPEELSPRFPSRILQYKSLIYDAVIALTKPEENPLGLKRKRWSGGPGWFGFGIGIRPPLVGLLCFSAMRWAENGMTPIWFQVSTSEGRCPKDVRASLGTLKLEPIVDEEWGPTVPILLPTGLEKDHVIQSMVQQVRRILEVVCRLPRWAVSGEVVEGENGNTPEAAGRESADETTDVPR